jgi:predicted HTH transcriptional regulator
LREFIANAIIHQDFSVTWAWPLIEIYSNRIEITNTWVPLIDTERLNIPETNYPAASKIISDTLKAWKIKEWERSKEYVPWWA